MSEVNAFLQTAWEGNMRLGGSSTSQDCEWCEIHENGAWRRIRFHDYAEIYRRRHLYEHLFYGLLQCQSPQRVVKLLGEVHGRRADAAALRVIDLGAGNGIVGQELSRLRIEYLVGVDILPEAREAVASDRPHVYDDYLVGDLTEPSPTLNDGLSSARANCLTCVAALGFGDVPVRAYFNAIRYVEVGGLVAFNIKEEFLDPRYTYGFSELIRRSQEAGLLRIEATERYQHRISMTGQPIFYTAIIASKLGEIPAALLVDDPRATRLRPEAQRVAPGSGPV
jgi:predicted TPR repeat methyltransferase